MAQPYVGEIRMFGGTFAINNWQLCDGSLLSIAQFDALFNLIGTTYGGDGQTTFAVPDLRGRAPVHVGGGLSFAQPFGNESVTLQNSQIPFHSHGLAASSGGANAVNPSGQVLADPGAGSQIYHLASGIGALQPFDIAAIQGNNPGGVQAHENMQPYLTINFIISLFGIFPSQT